MQLYELLAYFENLDEATEVLINNKPIGGLILKFEDDGTILNIQGKSDKKEGK